MERPAAYEWRNFTVIDGIESVPSDSEPLARPNLTVVAAACVMVAALLGGAAVAGITFIQATTASTSEQLSPR